MDSPHFPRWAHASIAQYLKAVANTNSITSLVEGIEDRTDTFMEADERVEFRVNGPLTYQPSNNYDIDTIYVNILATSLPGRRTKNRWQHHITIGHGRFLSPAPKRSWPRLCTCTFRANRNPSPDEKTKAEGARATLGQFQEKRSYGRFADKLSLIYEFFNDYSAARNLHQSGNAIEKSPRKTRAAICNSCLHLRSNLDCNPKDKYGL